MRKLLSVFISVLLTGCVPDPQPKTELEKLPAITQQGKDTFGCLVNGKAWVTRTSTDALAFYQSGALQISAGIDELNRSNQTNYFRAF